MREGVPSRRARMRDVSQATLITAALGRRLFISKALAKHTSPIGSSHHLRTHMMYACSVLANGHTTFAVRSKSESPERHRKCTIQYNASRKHLHCPPAACDIAACPAAVAASLERFRSASVADLLDASSSMGGSRLTGFLLALDLRDDGLNLGQVEGLQDCQ